MHPTELLQNIRDHSGGTYFSYAEIDREKPGVSFSERFHTRKDFVVPRQYIGVDQYFSALSFLEPRRSNDTVGGWMKLLFADLDGARPQDCDPLPSVAWETSYESYQAVWWLSKPIEIYGEWADLNRRLTYHVGADRGGWMGSKLLRIPGSYNWKRGGQRGHILPVFNLAYDPAELDVLFSPARKAAPAPVWGDHPEPLAAREREWLLRLHWPQLGLRARSMLSQLAVPDRSLHIIRCINELDKLHPNDIFQLIWVQPWNKWENNPGRLWQEIMNVVEYPNPTQERTVDNG